MVNRKTTAAKKAEEATTVETEVVKAVNEAPKAEKKDGELSKAAKAVEEAPKAAEEVAEAPKKTAAKKTTTRKTTEKKTPAKKPAAKKTAAKKEAVATVVLQYAGREVFEQDIMARAKADWVSAGHKEGDLKEITLYIKPEENVAYYVANGSDTGSFSY